MFHNSPFQIGWKICFIWHASECVKRMGKKQFCKNIVHFMCKRIIFQWIAWRKNKSNEWINIFTIHQSVHCCVCARLLGTISNSTNVLYGLRLTQICTSIVSAPRFYLCSCWKTFSRTDGARARDSLLLPVFGTLLSEIAKSMLYDINRIKGSNSIS